METPKFPLLAFVFGYLIPGLGHWYLGKRKKAILFFCLICCTFGIGFTLANFSEVAPRQQIVDRGRSISVEWRYSFVFQAGAGLLAWVPAAMHHFTIVLDKPGAVSPFQHIGWLYTVIAGLLNLLVAQDAFEKAYFLPEQKQG